MLSSYVGGIGGSFILASLVAWSWVKGIDYMHENHPDYTGDDLFGIDEDKTDKGQEG